ncbi:MAG: DNA-directed RNA polymerase subunit alpha [Dehalococcoidia bacterium]|nr:DNA-directed RNA polymerase subunit alpha [Dehalococcoidia bacterium]
MVESVIVLPSDPDVKAADELAPKLDTVETTATYGKFTLEPLPRGFAVTIGNPLRRVLLSSLEGAAVTWVRIEGVLNEYSTLPHMKEDVLEFLQNVKAVRLRPLAEMPGRLQLNAVGPGDVTAGDIIVPPEFEIVNPELHLASLDSAQGKLRVEFNVELGKGYVPAQHGENLPIGTLQVDAIFSPVRKINFAVERTRVGQVTDYDRLVLEVWTDGTITPTDAVQKASSILVDHLALLKRAGVQEAPPVISGVAAFLSPEAFNMPVEKLELSSRTFNCLKRSGINKVGELLERSKEDLEHIRNFGEKSLTELVNRLRERGLPLPAGVEAPAAEAAGGG